LIAILLAGTVASIVVAAFTGNSAFLGDLLTASFLATFVKLFLACLYVCAFYLVLSYTAGTIFRSSAVGIGVGIGLTFAEFIVAGIFDHLGGKWAGFAQHFPIQYTTGLPQRAAVPGLLHGTGMAQVGADVPHIGESLGFLAIYMAVLLVITFILVRARDVTS
jgi:hypothetical protein